MNFVWILYNEAKAGARSVAYQSHPLHHRGRHSGQQKRLLCNCAGFVLSLYILPKGKKITGVFGTLPGFDIGYELVLYCLARLFIYADDGVVMMSGLRTDDLLLPVVPCSSWSSSDLCREQIAMFP